VGAVGRRTCQIPSTTRQPARGRQYPRAPGGSVHQDRHEGSAHMVGMRSKLGLMVVALLIVYVVWGSTYLAIRVVVREMPPFLGMGSRFMVASAVLALILRLRGVDLRVTRAELAGSALLGLLLPFLGNGLVAL